MARRSGHKKHGIKRGRFGDWPDGVGSPDEVADRVTYTGNSLHKTYPSPAGPPALRSDKAKCDQYAEAQWPRLLAALRMAIRARCVSFRGGTFPDRAWVWINGTLHEARLTNPETGDYHGLPINDPRQYPQPSERLSAVPRVTIPVI